MHEVILLLQMCQHPSQECNSIYSSKYTIDWMSASKSIERVDNISDRNLKDKSLNDKFAIKTPMNSTQYHR